MSAGHSSLIGRVLDDRYRVIAEIGRGGHGTVYRGVHLQLDRAVAIKVIGTPSPGVERRFKREARAQARLRHPAVVKLLDFGHDHEGNPYMVQEFVDGESLRDHLKRGPPPAEETVTLVGDVLDALAEAHALGLVHRDVKPTNIMVAYGPRRVEARLLDFGVVKLIDPDSHTRLTRAGVVVGTPGYMAPEQVALQPVTPATDIYSVGVVLYQMLCGQRPFAGSLKEVLRAQLHDDPPPLPAEVPPAMARVAMIALARTPEQRFASADAMHDALRAALQRVGGRPLASAPPMRPSRPPPERTPAPRATAMLTPPPASPTPRLSSAPLSPPLSPPLPPDVSSPPLPTLAPTGPVGRMSPPPAARSHPPSGARTPPPTRPGPKRAPLGLVAILAVTLAVATAGFTLWLSRPDEQAGPVHRVRAGSTPAAVAARAAADRAAVADEVPIAEEGLIVVDAAASPVADASPDASPDAGARPAPPRRRARRDRTRREAPPRAPSPPTPAEPPPVVSPAPDAAPPADPRVSRIAGLEASIDAAFADCRCDAALGLVDDLARLDPASARLRRSRHRRRCRLALPGNCVAGGER